MTKGRREYRDRLFTFIFGSEEHRDWTLSLYNAVNDTRYTDPDAIELNTMKDVLCLSMRNDVSFIVAGEMNMYEQQSTYNPNMPLRMLQYASSLYEKHVTPKSKYAERLLPLPVPRLVVFYNGTRDAAEETTLLLSDSFPEGSDPDIEVRVRMVNINEGHSPHLMDSCAPLREYAWTVECIRAMMVGKKDDERALVMAEVIESMPEGFLIRPHLLAHKAEVIDMLLTEYDEAREMELLRQAYKEQFMIEGREAGHAEGLAEGRAAGLAEGRAEGLAEGRAEGLAEGRAEGRAAGLAEGRAEGRIEGVAQACHDLGLSFEDSVSHVAKVLGMTYEQAEPKVSQYWAPSD